MNEFWKDVKKNTNSNISLATNVDGSVGDTEIAEMWKCHYKSLLNSVQSEEFKKSVMLDINQQHETSITIIPFNILDALKSITDILEVSFPQNTLYLLIVAFTFYYHCYFLHLLHMLTCQICL